MRQGQGLQVTVQASYLKLIFYLLNYLKELEDRNIMSPNPLALRSPPAPANNGVEPLDGELVVAGSHPKMAITVTAPMSPMPSLSECESSPIGLRIGSFDLTNG